MTETATKKFKLSELTGAAKNKAVEHVREKYIRTMDRSDEISEWFKELLKEWLGVDLEVGWSLSYCQGDGVAFWGNLYVPDLWKAQQWVSKSLRLNKYLGDDGQPTKAKLTPEWRAVLLEARLDDDSMNALRRMVKRDQGPPMEIRHSRNYFHNRSMDCRVKEFGSGYSDPEPKAGDFRPDVKYNCGTEKRPNWIMVHPVVKQFYDDCDALEKGLDQLVSDISRQLEKLGYAELEAHESEENVVDYADNNDVWFNAEGEEVEA